MTQNPIDERRLAMRKLVYLRRASQAFFLLLFIYILWSTTYPLKGILPPETFFRTNPSIMIFTAISERVFLPGLVFAGIMIMLTLVLGRFYCGWICPLGTMIDLSGSTRKGRNLPGYEKGRKLRNIKFFILGTIAVFAALGYQTAWVLDPMGIMARFVSLNLMPTVTLAFDKAFAFVISRFELYGPVYDLYRSLKASFLGVEVRYFASSGVIFSLFVLVCVLSLFVSRFWCRAICPLGALYSILARFSIMRRVARDCIGCKACVSYCRTGAIKDGEHYDKGECVMCMDCVYDCPTKTTKFVFPEIMKREKGGGAESSMSRKDFLFLLFSSVFLLGAGKRECKERAIASNVIRPPGALKEKDFYDRCIRCGNCMKVCPTNGLQPVMLQAGLESIWTPHLVPEIGYCEYQCNLCGHVCPTGAIPRLAKDVKMKTKLGTAKVNRTTCIAWAYGKECLVCEEHCPVSDKAIKVIEEESGEKVIKKPVVDPRLCVGCGICQTKCPVRPARAIQVDPSTADRS